LCSVPTTLHLFLPSQPTTIQHMPPLEYRTTDVKDIELIRPLWIQLNEHRHTLAKTFRSHYEQWTFDDRKAYFEKVAAAGSLQLDLAFDSQRDRCVGYCVSSLSREKTGEIESVFVDDAYRSQGIGTALMTRALAWLDMNGSVKNRVPVADGNEAARDFYKKFGFYPRKMVLEQKKE
jgi:diamine N-acetyltransferase